MRAVKYRPIEERFFDKVNQTAGCWLWIGCKNTDGYRQLALSRGYGKTERAHRISWIIHKGPIPKGMHVLHDCDNTSCVNPKHLHLGTHQDNMAEMYARRPPKTAPQDGERNNASKLTARQVLKIRRFASDGAQQKDIAKEFGISKANVCLIVSGKRWAHL